MLDTTKNLDPAFQGVGQKIGIEIWRIENFQPVPLSKSDYGKFYSGDSYIVLQTSSRRGGAYLYDIHFWIGKDTSKDEAGTAAIKTVELDAALGGRAIQHRELQGFESEKFVSYFKPCIIPLEGGVTSGFKKPEEEKFETRLYICKGKRVARLKQVPFARSSLNHDDVFILDTENKIYQFNGEHSNIQEKAKALEVIQHLKDEYHKGKCDVGIIDDGKLVAESDSGEFWVLLGGFAPIGRKTACEDDASLETSAGKLYRITDGQLKIEGGVLSKAMLENNKCYLLDCGAEVFVWFGRFTQVEDRKMASQAAEVFINNQNRPKSTRITCVIEGYETQSFKSNFDSWSLGTGIPSGDGGRGKVAALLKQQGIGVKSTIKSLPVDEKIPPLLESGGKMEIWHIDGNTKTQVSTEEIGKFYSGDCYVVLYTYHSCDKKEDYFLSFWMGKDSTQDDRTMAACLANTMCNSLKGRPVQSRIFEGKEPPQFVAIFQHMVVLKGGVSSGFKKSIAGRSMTDETYTPDGVALIHISSSFMHDYKAVQVDLVATSLSSDDCFLLQSGSSLFLWQGNSSTLVQQQWAAKVAEFLKPGVTAKFTKEGKEPSSFWSALGGKESYTSKKAAQDTFRDPRLFTVSLSKGKLEVSEVYNFSQDDLLTEDILMLDTHAEVFVWIGQSVDANERQNASDIGQKYIDLAVSMEGLSPTVPLFKITEGNEPCFFTTYFSWDNRKATVFSDSYAKNLSLLFGAAVHDLESADKTNGPNHEGPTQRASAMAALTSAFNPSSSAKTMSSKPTRSGQCSQRAAAVAALSNVLTAEQKKASETPSTEIDGNPPQPSGEPKCEDADSKVEDHPEAVPQTGGSEEVEKVEPIISITSESGNEVNPESEISQDNQSAGESTFNYERLKTKSIDPVEGINYKEREAYLSDAEFETVMGMTKDEFYGQPKWKQDMQKRKVDLF